ncbi:LLM class F420-dependent oxidoreductase [Dactylosporangium sp. CA-092794]|uniref:LLM class F420-dependent oxidoreductase n=1 Tax=Dactylosporangium sp. CA-092794 TaxID=3239929 RepID=UPI003D8A1B96
MLETSISPKRSSKSSCIQISRRCSHGDSFAGGLDGSISTGVGGLPLALGIDERCHLKVGIFTYLTDYGPSPIDVGRAVELHGFESLYVPEHTHIPAIGSSSWPGGGTLPRRNVRTLDPFIALTAVASTTERLRVGTCVSLVAQRDAIILAKEIGSLDRIAPGRFDLGVSPGWNAEEAANHGVTKHRTARMLETIEALRAIWAGDPAEFHGRFIDFDPIYSWPKPRGDVPIFVAGGGPTVLERVLSHGDGWIPPRFPLSDLPAVSARIRELRDRAGEQGRELSVTVYGAANSAAGLEAYGSAGVDRVLLELEDHGGDHAAAFRQLDDLARLLRDRR